VRLLCGVWLFVGGVGAVWVIMEESWKQGGVTMWMSGGRGEGMEGAGVLHLSWGQLVESCLKFREQLFQDGCVGGWLTGSGKQGGGGGGLR
jgi:hypothetical protein